jgi:hypothetical protein
MDWTARQVALPNGATARAVEVTRADALGPALHAGDPPLDMVVLLFGGADRMDEADTDRLRTFFASAFIPAVVSAGAVVVDGGTDTGVMRLVGEAAEQAGAAGRPVRLIGVAVRSLVRLPGDPANGRAEPARGHSDLVLVPGMAWGDEGEWMHAVADVLAEGRSVSVVVNGGPVAWREASAVLTRGGTVIAVAGSGRSADRLARLAGSGASRPDEAVGMVPTTGRILAVDLRTDAASFARMLKEALRSGSRREV